MSHTTHPGLDALWLTEAVRLREEQAGPLEDSEALRQALAQGGSLPRRILTRAHWLGRREGLLDAQRTWRQGSRLALALLLVLALASGAGLAFAALGDGPRPVNVFWALASLLGLHLLTLVLRLKQFTQRRIVEQRARRAAGHPADGQRAQPARAAGAHAADVGAIDAIGMQGAPELGERLGGKREILRAAGQAQTV
ncbi:hypothetical protein LZM17_05555, partial [Pseudomonas aeruginosa]|nr:hypothetical protein [Pseudomonas aeruginosa]